MVHFLLDTRTNYQKFTDWIRTLFKRPKALEITRVLSSPERHNRSILNMIRPIGLNRENLKETSNICHKIRDDQSPVDSTVVKNNYLRCLPYLESTPRSKLDCPERSSQLPCSVGGSRRG